MRCCFRNFASSSKAPAPPKHHNSLYIVGCRHSKVGQAFPPAHALLFPQFRKFLESACTTKTSQFLVHSWLSARQGGAGVSACPCVAVSAISQVPRKRLHHQNITIPCT